MAFQERVKVTSSVNWILLITTTIALCSCLKCTAAETDSDHNSAEDNDRITGKTKCPTVQTNNISFMCCEESKNDKENSCFTKVCSSPGCKVSEICLDGNNVVKCACNETGHCDTCHTACGDSTDMICLVNTGIKQCLCHQEGDCDTSVTKDDTVLKIVIPLAVIVVIIVIIAVVVRVSKKSSRNGTHLSRFTASFRKRLGRDGISNPVFVIEGGHRNAQTIQRSGISNADNTPTNNGNSLTTAPEMPLYDVPSSAQRNKTLNSYNPLPNENYYVEHEPTLHTVNNNQNQDANINLQYYKNNDNNVNQCQAKYNDVPKLMKIESEDHYEIVVTQPPKDIKPIPSSDKEENYYQIPPNNPRPVNEGPKENISQRLRKKKKSRKRRKEPIYGNVESDDRLATRDSSTLSSDDARNSGDIYLNVAGAKYNKSYPHKSLVEPDDTYDLATRCPDEDIYVDYDGTLHRSQDGATLPHTDMETVYESDTSSDGDDIYQTVDDADHYDVVIGTHIENPLFGVQMGEQLDNHYDNDIDDEDPRAVNLGNDHIYDTVA